MKNVAASAAIAVALSAAAVQTPPDPLEKRDMLMQFLEYRDAGSPALFRASAAKLRALADSEPPADASPADRFRRAMAMSLVATYSMDPVAKALAPDSLSVDRARREALFASARETLDNAAARVGKARKNGEPSWKLYLDALEDGAKADSAGSAAEKEQFAAAALSKLEQAAGKGDKRAKVRLAQSLLQRAMAAKNARARLDMEKRAVKLLEDAGEFHAGANADRHGASPSALNLLGRCLESGVGSRDAKGKPLPRPKGALRAYIDAASAGHPGAMHNLARFRFAGRGGGKDLAAACRAEHAAAQAGHPDAMAEWGRLLMDGMSGTNGETLVKQDVKAGREWIRNAAEEGSVHGAYLLGSMLAAETPQMAETATEAAKWLDIAAVASKLPSVRYEAAKAMLAPGAADAASGMRAVAHLSQAAKRGHVQSMELLAECLENGRGVTQSREEAVFWRMKARAMRGDVAAASWLKKRERDSRNLSH